MKIKNVANHHHAIHLHFEVNNSGTSPDFTIQDTLATASPSPAPAPSAAELLLLPPGASREEPWRRRPVQRDGPGGRAWPQGALAEVVGYCSCLPPKKT